MTSKTCDLCGVNLMHSVIRHHTSCSAKPPPSSSDYEWKLMLDKDGDEEEEEFEAGMFYFNITRAKKIIKKTPRPVIQISVEPYAVFLEMLVELDKRKRTFDVNFPVILATLKQGGLILIDGWHRLDLAIKSGVTEIPAVVLTKEETKKVRRR